MTVEVTLTVTEAVAVLVGSATLVAVMTTGVDAVTFGAVKIPCESTLPELALQVTAVFMLFEMLAAKRCTPPEGTVAESGEMTGAMEFALAADCPELKEHPTENAKKIRKDVDKTARVNENDEKKPSRAGWGNV